MEHGTFVLEDGTRWEGVSCGSRGEVSGQAVFFTGVVGYQEVLTDPASLGNLVVMTYPLIGNCGVNDEGALSGSAWCRGLVVRELSRTTSNWQAKGSLQDFAVSSGTVILSGVDTQGVTQHLRSNGSQRAVLATGDGKTAPAGKTAAVDGRNLKKVSRAAVGERTPDGKAAGRLAVVDLGVRNDHLRTLLDLGFHLTLFPFDTPAGDILACGADGVVFSSGPEHVEGQAEAVAAAAGLIGKKPLMGIGLGSQVLALALGGSVAPLKCGHFGLNQPVRSVAKGRCLTTSQLHRFAVGAKFADRGVEITHVNLTDGTVEGFSHPAAQVLAVQYLPDAGDPLFTDFTGMIHA